jgi:hypothetical protein
MVKEKWDAFSTSPFSQQPEFQLLYQKLTYLFGKNLSVKGENLFDWAHMKRDF